MIFQSYNFPVNQIHTEYQDTFTRERVLAPKKTKVQTYLELRELVRLFQTGDTFASEELYSRFQGLIVKKLKLSYVEDAFGEDAENILWEIFYEIVHSIDLNNTKRIAGFIEEALNNKLIDKLRKTIRPWEIISYEYCEEEGIQFADTRDGYVAVFTNSDLESAISSLKTPAERLLIRKHYGEDASLQVCAACLMRSYKATCKLKYKVLRKLRSKYVSEKNGT